MIKEYNNEQLQKLYQNLPEELQEAIFSVETADSIWDISGRYDIEKISIIAKRVGNVLVGALPPEELQEVLEKELNIGVETAKKIVREINRFIFLPVRPFLEKLYSTEITTSEKPVARAKVVEEGGPKEDVYREPIE